MARATAATHAKAQSPGAEEQGTRVKDVHELLASVALVNVRFYEITAQRSETPLDDTEDAPIPFHALKLGFGDEGIEVRLTTDLATRYGDVRVDAGVQYQTVPEDLHVIVPPEVALDFANKVGIMALVPYIREAISTITQKVFDDAIVMPLVRPGDLEFSPVDQPGEISEGSGSTQAATGSN